MTNDNVKNDNNGVNPVAAVIVGAVVGATVVAGATAMQDKTNTDKVKKVLNEAKENATDGIENLQKQVHDTKAKIQKEVNETKEKIEEAVNTVKESVNS